MANGIVKFDDYLTKLASAFTDEERELFVNSFALHMKHRKDPNAFVINIEDVVTWLGFSRKDKVVHLLKHFDEEVDFSTAPSTEGAVFRGGGHNKECIMLSVKTFKKMCMIAKTTKADQVRNYHIKMEEVLFDHVEACNGELQQQLVASKLQGDFDKSQGIVNGNGDVSLCYLIQAVLPAGCDALSQLVGDETLNKFGQTDRLKDRLPELDAGVRCQVEGHGGVPVHKESQAGSALPRFRQVRSL
jgi:phage anti-repressor protein